MRERANKVSGRLRIESAPGRGTRIELTVHAGEERPR
jgi:signal transduction histidine kinase